MDIGELEECPSNTIPGFVERLCAWLPTLSEHRCSIGEPGGFVKRLHMGTWPAHILEHVTLELQNLAGTPGGFGRARETAERGVYKVAVSAEHEDVTRACLEAGRELVMAAIEDTPFDVKATIERLRELVRTNLLGPNTACIVDAAKAKDRGIPAIRLSADNLVQLGYGSRQRRIWAAETDRTGAIAVEITRTPDLARRLLKSCGLPVADPDDRESEVRGQPHRLLVVGGNLVAAARIEAGSDPNTPCPVAADVTDRVHPATAAAACLAARVVGLDIAGVDLMADDLAIPLADQHGALTAVHAGPGLVPHMQSADGTPRPVGRAIVDHLFPNGDTGRIPVVGITGSVGTTAVARLVAEFLRLSGKVTGLACGDGLFLDRRQVATGDCGDWQSATRVLMNRSVEAAVLENNAEVILGQGLAYDRCQVGVVTRIEPEKHFGPYYVASPEYVFKIFRTQVDVVLPDGVAVLDAADPLVADMARLCDGEVIFFALDPALPVITEHQARGGRTVCVHGDELVLTTADGASTLIELSAIPFLNGERANDSVACVLAAVGAAWALGIAFHVIRTGVETYIHDPAGGRHPEPPSSVPVSRS